MMQPIFWDFVYTYFAVVALGYAIMVGCEVCDPLPQWWEKLHIRCENRSTHERRFGTLVVLATWPIVFPIALAVMVCAGLLDLPSWIRSRLDARRDYRAQLHALKNKEQDSRLVARKNMEARRFR